ncbi:hypothetical protein G6F37_004397 [Rhizopus arrhizus]|nr:hypothetical protein G6F38_004544 [Rhizopus arrhizus]KAG1159996.1 hypothetical protein G6F37_004397 [Rhizopus arrhizus]
MQRYLTLLLWTFLYYLVKADQINIIQPRSSSVYHVNDEITISYNIRSMGMTRIWSTLVTLTQADNNQTIQEFPSLAYSNSNDNKDINDTWANEIEQDLSRLLDSIEKLLEALTAWSLGKNSKIQICENYDALELHLSNLTRALQSVTKSTE